MHMPCIQQLVIHRNQHTQAILQLVLVNDAGSGGCREVSSEVRGRPRMLGKTIPGRPDDTTGPL